MHKKSRAGGSSVQSGKTSRGLYTSHLQTSASWPDWWLDPAGSAADSYLDSDLDDFLRRKRERAALMDVNLTDICDLRPLLAQLSPGLTLSPEHCTDPKCDMNQRYLRDIDRELRSIVYEEPVYNTARLFLPISNELSPSASSRLSDLYCALTPSAFLLCDMYRILAAQSSSLKSLLSRALTVAEELEPHLDLELLRYIRSHGDTPWYTTQYWSSAYREPPTYRHMIHTVTWTDSWTQRQFLHAVLLSIRTRRDQQEAFQRMQGQEILLPVHIDSAWPRALHKTQALLKNHSNVYRQNIEDVIWFGPCRVHLFLKKLSLDGFPHIAQELQRHLNGRRTMRFTDTRKIHNTHGQGASSAADPPADISIKYTPHLQHPLQHHTLPSSEDLLDSWLFTVSGALAPQWTRVCQFLQVNQRELETVKEASWYNNKHRLFHILKNLQNERNLSPAQLSCALLSYCEKNEHSAHVQRVIRAALPHLCAEYQTLERRYSEFYPFHVTQSDKLLALSSESKVTVEEISGAEFEPFLTSYAIVGLPYNVSAKPGDQVLIFLPSDVSLEMHWSQAHLSQCLESLSSLTHCDSHLVLHAQLSGLLNEDERERLFRYLLIGMFDEAAELILQNGLCCIHMLERFLGAVGAQIKLWPQMYCSMIEASSIRIGHLTKGNLEVLVPLAYARSWAVILTDSFSPWALLINLFIPNQVGAMFLVYKPVGRRYREQQIKSLKMFIIPQKETLAQELDDRQTGYVKFLIKHLIMEKKIHYRLVSSSHYQNVDPETQLFHPVHSVQQMLTEFNVEMSAEAMKKQQLVLQLSKAKETKTVFEVPIDMATLKKKKEDFVFMIHNSMKKPLCEIIDDTSCERIFQTIERRYPSERYTIYHKLDGTSYLIDDSSSLQYVIQNRPYGDFSLETKEKQSSPGSPAAQSPAGSSEPLPASFLGPSPAPLSTTILEKLPTSLTLKDHSAERFLRENRSELIKRIGKIDPTLDKLLDRRIISMEEYDTIRCAQPHQEKVRVTLDMIIRKGSRATEVFYQILADKQECVMKDLLKNFH